MSVLVVIESLFGNTRRVADAIVGAIPGATLASAGDVAEVPAGVTLLIVGAPTHDMSLPSSRTRAQAVKRFGAEAMIRGVRELAGSIKGRPDVVCVTFDTSTKGGTMFGSAAKAAAKLLRKRGFGEVVVGESFLVTDVKGPLADGELERAVKWAGDLAAKFVRR